MANATTTGQQARKARRNDQATTVPGLNRASRVPRLPSRTHHLGPPPCFAPSNSPELDVCFRARRGEGDRPTRGVGHSDGELVIEIS